MPELVKVKKKSYDGCMTSGEPEYPYGLSLSIDDAMIEELGIGQLAAGDEVMVVAKAFVRSKSEHQDTEDSEKTISIQLTEMSVNRNSDNDDMADRLYK